MERSFVRFASLVFGATLLLATACRADPVNPFAVAPGGGGTTAGEGGSTGTGGRTTPTNTGGAPMSNGNPDTGPPPTGTPQALGQPCGPGVSCTSGFCVDGVCCNSGCDRTCSSCVLPGLVGTCVNVTAGEDPRNDCPAEPTESCGRAGGCDGMGRCLKYQLGTECRPLTCRDGIEIMPSRCTAAGVCTPGDSRVCASNMCSNGRCLQGCASGAPCSAGFECKAGSCQGNGPALHWRFDEEAGTTATDSSGHALAGVYLGDGRTPTPSTSVPPTTFTNPRSRSFAATGRPAVQLPNVSGSLKPPTELTVSVWFRTPTASMAGTDIVSLGGDYFIRLKPTDIEWVKRVSNVAGMTYGVARVGTLTNHVDNKWHHAAGVGSSTGMRFYLDGQLRASNARGEPILYMGNALWVGRDGQGATTRDFSGEVDDLRIYTRALSAEEITALAGGAM